MTIQPILLDDAWVTPENAETFAATNPATGQPLPGRYPVSDLATLTRMAKRGRDAAQALAACPPEQIALFLRTYADNIDQHREPIARMAHQETGLPYQPRLAQTEMDRAIDQLRQAADSAVDRTWACASIETDLNLRSMYEPLGGAVLVIGPSNFPLAYNGIAGGDFAAAIAAGNPVIAKAHTLHPGTTLLLARQALAAAQHAKLPPASVQMFYQCAPDDGLTLIRTPQIAAVGFTGSRKTGLALKQAADETGTPIYLELSSINPVFVLPGAAAARGQEIAQQLADSMLAASGQQCTSPGLIALIDDQPSQTLTDALAQRLAQAHPQPMLSEGGVEHLREAIKAVSDAGAELIMGDQRPQGPASAYAHTLLATDADRFLQRPDAMQTEMFGVAALTVLCATSEQLLAIARALEGNLTGSIYSENSDGDGADDQLALQLSAALRPKVGRLLNDHVPTGVSVRPSMVHAGPFPATGHPGFTAVGMPTAIHRFAALRCYDRVRHDRLPQALRDTNPTGAMLRRIDGRWTTENAAPGARRRDMS